MKSKSKKTKYPGEITLLNGSYPVTKNGKLNCNRVRSALGFGTMHGDIKKLERAGIKKYAAKCGFDV